MVRGGRHLGDKAYFPTHVESVLAVDEGAPGDADADDGAALALALTADLADADADSDDDSLDALAPDEADQPGEADEAGEANEDLAQDEANAAVPSSASKNRAYLSGIESEVLEAFIAQHYLGNRIPPVLVVSHAPANKELVELLI